jgi:predicted transcriptional regulator
MNIQLDELLANTSPVILNSNRKTLKLLINAYKVSSPGMISKPKTDIISNQGGFAFHYGSTDPEMRTLTSWILTNSANKRKLTKLIPKLWNRRGREDLKLVGLLLANLSKEDLKEDPWIILIQLFKKQEPLETILEIAEEMNRSEHKIPDDEWLIAMAEQSILWHQIAMLFISIREQGVGKLKQLVMSAPSGGELFERIRNHLLTSNS